MHTILETERTILRPWRLSDAEDLYLYASDDRVGPPAGWPPHRSVDESKEIIRNIFMRPGVFAVTLRGEDRAIGCIGIICGKESNFDIPDNEGEISYWIGVPFWGQGLIPEAMHAMIRYGFEEMGLTKIWCGYFDGNQKSKRAQEKGGFKHHHTSGPAFCQLTGDERIEHVSLLTRQEWLENTR